MPYSNEHRSIRSMSDLRVEWLTQHRHEILALAPIICPNCTHTDGAKCHAQSAGKWEHWRKAFMLAAIGARYMEASTVHSSKKVWSIRAELADYIRKNGVEFLSARRYEAAHVRNRMTTEEKEFNRAIRDHDRAINER